jgi:hypothetical protein
MGYCLGHACTYTGHVTCYDVSAPKAGRLCGRSLTALFVSTVGSLTDNSVYFNSWQLQELLDRSCGLRQLRSECAQLYPEVLPHRQVVWLLICKLTICTNGFISKVTICTAMMLHYGTVFVVP